MSTKFVSKNSNYMVVLKPGVEGNRALGTHAVSGLYVKFQSGVVDVKEDSIVEMLRSHPAFGSDFIEVKQDEIDPYVDTREDIEPEHVISEIKYGHSEGMRGTPKKMSAIRERIESAHPPKNPANDPTITPSTSTAAVTPTPTNTDARAP